MLTTIKILGKVLHTLIILLLLFPLTLSSLVFSSSIFHSDVIGYDISYPQCNKAYPEDPAFAIIGVNGGRPFTKNPCLSDQAKWAAQKVAALSVYQNLNNFSPSAAEYMLLGPNNCTPEDQQCFSYNYGYQAAKYAHDYVKENQVRPQRWWLDIETMNTWSKDKSLNVEVIKGAIDYHAQQLHLIGIYSTKFQWIQIAGDFKTGHPSWVAGGKSRQDSQAKCSEEFSFTGGRVAMVQYIENNFDNNILC